jgi:hypothetical protein
MLADAGLTPHGEMSQRRYRTAVGGLEPELEALSRRAGARPDGGDEQAEMAVSRRQGTGDPASRRSTGIHETRLALMLCAPRGLT